MQMSGGKEGRKKEQPVQRSWGRGILVSLEQHRASMAMVWKKRAEWWETESERKAEGATHKGLQVLLKMSVFIVNTVGIHWMALSKGETWTN